MNWRQLPSLTALRAFCATAQYRNLSRAAEALNVTHSAVSQQIRVLERQLGTRLIIRERRGINLTQQGEFLANGLGEAFARIASLTEDMTQAEAARPLLVSATPMFSYAFLMPRLAAFVEAHPEIELNIDSTIEAVELRPGGVDMAIRYGTGKWPGLECQLLLPGCLTVVASRKLVGDRNFKEPAEILDYPILQEHASVEFDLWLEKVGISPDTKRNVVRLPGNMLLDGIRRGDGIGATAPPFIADELRDGRLVALFDDPIPDIGYYMVTLPGMMRPSLNTFMRWFESTISDQEKRLFRWPPAHLI